MVAPLPPAPASWVTPSDETWDDKYQRVLFTLAEQNPDHDIEPSTAHKCFRLSKPGCPRDDGRHLFYGPNGKLVGSIPEWKTKDLLRRYLLMCGNEEVVSRLHPRGFVQEVCHLMRRYENGERTDKSGTYVNLKNHWAVPSDIYSALSQAFTLSTERFASPLNVAVETELYYSVYERDAIFGAQLYAYSVQWLGASEANPEYDTEAVSKALRWGIRSAAATEAPVLTVFRPYSTTL
jgi:hypothetical protein